MHRVCHLGHVVVHTGVGQVEGRHSPARGIDSGALVGVRPIAEAHDGRAIAGTGGHMLDDRFCGKSFWSHQVVRQGVGGHHTVF